MIIKNVQVINPNNTIMNANVYIQKSKIEKVVQVEGKANAILIPGFIDIHIHGINGFDVMEGPKAVQAISKELAKWGTTSFAPTLMTAPFLEIVTTLEKMQHLKVEGANMIGFHLEGPFIAKAKSGAHDPNSLLKASKLKLEKLIVASNQKLKKIVLAPEATSLDLVKYLKRQNVIVAIGHSNAYGQEVENFIKSGASSATHLWNGMSGFKNRKPGVAQIVLSTKNINAELICDFIHVDLKTLKLTIDIKSPNQIMAITDAIKFAKSGFKSGVAGGLDINYQNNAYRVKKTGSIAGGETVMYDNFKNLVKLGFTLNDIVKMTSFNQAQEFKLNKGSIAKGKDADFLLLDQKLNLKEVVIGGKLWK